MSLYRKTQSLETQSGQSQLPPSAKSSSKSQSKNYEEKKKKSKFDSSSEESDHRPNAYDSSDNDGDEPRHVYGPNQKRVIQNELAVQFDEHGNELFVADEKLYQKEGIVHSLHIKFVGQKKIKRKTMVVKFVTPDGAPEDWRVPNLTVKDTTINTVYKIDNSIQKGDYVYFDSHLGKWFKDPEKSAELEQEREAEAIIQGKGPKRVVLNTERMLSPTGIPALFYEVPLLAQQHLLSAAVTTIGEKTSTSEAIMKKNAREIKSLAHAVNATHTRSPTALSIPNSLHNLNTILSGVYLWKQQLLPKVQTTEFVRRLMSLGSDKNIRNPLDSFVERSYDLDILPRIKARANRLEHRRAILQKVTKEKVNMPELVARRKEILERQKRLAAAQLELTKLKNDDYKRKEQEKLMEAEQKELKKQLAKISKEKRAKSPKKKRSRQFVDSETDYSDFDQSGQSDWDSDNDVDSDNIIDDDDNSDDAVATPKKRGVSTRSAVSPKPRTNSRTYTARLYGSSDDDDDDRSDGEIELRYPRRDLPPRTIQVKGDAVDSSTGPSLPTVKPRRVILNDDDSDDEFLSFLSSSKDKRQAEMNSGTTDPIVQLSQ